jgi:hypothetical protein
MPSLLLLSRQFVVTNMLSRVALCVDSSPTQQIASPVMKWEGSRTFRAVRSPSIGPFRLVASGAIALAALQWAAFS